MSSTGGVSAIIVALMLAGCTTAAMYEGARHAQRNRCLPLPETERQACLDRIADDYPTYQRRRHTPGAEPGS